MGHRFKEPKAGRIFESEIGIASAGSREPEGCETRAGPRSPRSGSNGSRMRHSESVRSPELNAASSRKAALNQNSIPLSKTVNTA